MTIYTAHVSPDEKRKALSKLEEAYVDHFAVTRSRKGESQKHLGWSNWWSGAGRTADLPLTGKSHL